MIDALRENRVRSDKCIGDVHISLFDLEQQQLQLTDNQGESQLIDLRTEGKNVLSLLLDNDLSYAELLYDLTGPAFAALSRLSGDRELIFSIGGEEALASVTPGGTLRFDNPAHINLLDGADLLTIRLYQSNDAANVLWEYALSDSRIILHSIAQGSPENGKRAVESQITDEHFFSALGNKKVFVNVAGYGAKDKVRLVSVEGDAFSTLPAAGQDVVFNSGHAKFVFNGGAGVVPDPALPNKKIRVSFLITPDPSDNAKPSPFTLSTSVIIKNNSNISLQALLEGVSVWTKTTIPTGLATAEKEKYIGKTIGSDTDKQYVDYAQYMMNMISIPLIKDIKESNIKYSIAPTGIFEQTSENLLKALMDDNFVVSTTPPIPGFAGEELTVKQVISHFDNESKGVVLPRFEGYRTLRKLLQDYQDDNFSQTFSTLDTLEKMIDAELDPVNAPTLSFNDYRYRIITPEAMRGLALNVEEGRTIAFDNEFIDKDLGIYELYQSYDWDGDGLSNLAEVENVELGFEPMNQDEQNINVQMAKTAYSRGNVGVQAVNTAATVLEPRNSSRGLGEISSLSGEVVPGLRLPTFSPGMYDFPAGNVINVDTYTTPRILNTLEAIGREWAKLQPDTYPLEEKPDFHNRTNSGDHAGNLRIGINDISPKGGGVNGSTVAQMNAFGLRAGRTIPNTMLGHGSHQNGLDMDLRYIGFKVSGEDVERSVDVGNRSVYDNARTIELLKNIKKIAIENQVKIKNIFVGRATTQSNFVSLQTEFGRFVVSRQGGHNDHIHLRFSIDELSRTVKLPSGSLVLSYVPPPSNATPAQISAAIAASTHVIPLLLEDKAGNSLLPWTRITFDPDNNAVMQVRSDHPTQSGRLWVNYNNSVGAEGQVVLKIQCVSKNTSPNPLRLKDKQTGEVLLEMQITCQ